MNAGTRLDHYEIVDKIGESGMGAVCLATDSRLGRKRADLSGEAELIRKAQVVVASSGREWFPTISPDGAFVAYQSNATSNGEIYIIEVANQRRWLMSTSGAANPLWSSGGNEIAYATDAAGLLSATRIRVVLDWFEELKARVPTDR